MALIPTAFAPGRYSLAGWLLTVVLCVTSPGLRAAHDGDINSDGAVDPGDLLWGVQALTGVRTLTIAEQEHGDVAPLVDGYSVPDGLFNLGDVAVLYRLIAGEVTPAFAGLPANQFSAGDSIAEGEAATGGIGVLNHDKVWSTGYNGSDGVNSLNERLAALDPTTYYENDSTRDAIFNHGRSGAVMADFAGQAAAIVADSASVPGGTVGKVAILLGSNDVCAGSEDEMTDTAIFRDQYIAGLEVLASSPATRDARIDVVSIPPIYWLWNAKYSSGTCRFIWFIGQVCQSLLSGANDDCANDTSRLDPDNDYAGDGGDCLRRKRIHRNIRQFYNNEILRDVLQGYIASGELPNARYTDLYDVQFNSTHVNNNDCFHPSLAGHALLADSVWCRSPLGVQDAACSP
jgi:lysophospholipase L1-like esterase